MGFEDVQFQLVEAPAVMVGSADGRAWGLRSLALARNADGLILMVDLSRDPVEQLILVLTELEKARVLTNKPRGRVEINRRYMGAGLRVILIGKLLDSTIQDVKKLLRSYRVGDAVVKISGEVTLDDVEDAIFESTIYRPTIVVANKIDASNAKDVLRQTHAGEQLVCWRHLAGIRAARPRCSEPRRHVHEQAHALRDSASLHARVLCRRCRRRLRR